MSTSCRKHLPRAWGARCIIELLGCFVCIKCAMRRMRAAFIVSGRSIVANVNRLLIMMSVTRSCSNSLVRSQLSNLTKIPTAYQPNANAGPAQTARMSFSFRRCLSVHCFSSAENLKGRGRGYWEGFLIASAESRDSLLFLNKSGISEVFPGVDVLKSQTASIS